MTKKTIAILAVLMLMMTASCGKETGKVDLNHIAEEYVKLAFAVGKFDSNYVDAYFGPVALKKQAESMDKNLTQVEEEARSLLGFLEQNSPGDKEELAKERNRFLKSMLSTLLAKVELLKGKKMTFDQESRALYGAVSPPKKSEYYDKILARLDQLLPGKEEGADLDKRFNDFVQQFIIPPDKVDAVFRAATEEGRRRTKQFMELPEKEDFVLEYVTNKPWGAYNWFKGNSVSLIQVNLDLPIMIDRAIDLACHEGYPGHHVFSTMVEQKLYKERGWVEFSIYPLYSPQSLLMEGTANFGISVAFPGSEKSKFEKEVLFPLAGLDPAKVELYEQILKLKSRLTYARNDTARMYRDGKIQKEEAVERLMRYQLSTRARAEKYLSFIDTYGAYLITYNLGLDMVRDYIEKRLGDEDTAQNRWQEFIKLLSKPVLPGDLL